MKRDRRIECYDGSHVKFDSPRTDVLLAACQIKCIKQARRRSTESAFLELELKMFYHRIKRDTFFVMTTMVIGEECAYTV